MPKMKEVEHMHFIDNSQLSPEQRLILLEKENADLKLQLEKRQINTSQNEILEVLKRHPQMLRQVLHQPKV